MVAAQLHVKEVRWTPAKGRKQRPRRCHVKKADRAAVDTTCNVLAPEACVERINVCCGNKHGAHPIACLRLPHLSRLTCDDAAAKQSRLCLGLGLPATTAVLPPQIAYIQSRVSVRPKIMTMLLKDANRRPCISSFGLLALATHAAECCCCQQPRPTCRHALQ
jgi:hypothetical protein